jgi:hypothetical protein
MHSWARLLCKSLTSWWAEAMGRLGPCDGSAAPGLRVAKAAREGRAIAFTQAAVSRAVRGVAAAGLEPSEVQIEPSGTIRLLFGSPDLGPRRSGDLAASIEKKLGYAPE